MTATFYKVEDERGLTFGTWNSEFAERLSRSGLRVTATTVGERP